MVADPYADPDSSGAAVHPPEVDLRTSIRPTIAGVDLGAIRRNFDRLQDIAGGAEVWAVIKADAYGHGAVPVARELVARGGHGNPMLAVSLVEEALELRAAGIRAPILVLGAYYDHRHADVVAEALTPVVYDPAELDQLAQAAASQRVRIDVHLKIDTGMSRLGIAPDALDGVLDQIERRPSLRLAGLCTHLASADAADPAETDEALLRFRACLQLADRRGFVGLANHAANSAAAIRYPGSRFHAIRPGLALYGAMPAATVHATGFEPALRLSTKIMAIRDVPAGRGVSYGHQWRAPRPSRIATLPIGYADGYPRHVAEAEVIVRGRRVDVVGAVCMDMMMIDVTDVTAATLDDTVTLIGIDGVEQITVDDVARWAGTVNYEILCGISKRVPRVYKS